MKKIFCRFLLYCFLIGFTLAIYFLMAQIPLTGRYVAKRSFIDQAIPLLPWTSVIYISYIAMPLVMFLSISSTQRLAHLFWGYVSLVFLSAVFFWVVPLQMTHHPLADQDIWSLLIRVIRWFDVSTNLLPSLHVSIALFGPLYLLFGKELSLKNFLFLLWALLICLSTMTTKQHYFADVVSGGTVALFLAIPWAGYTRAKPEKTSVNRYGKRE